MAKVLNILALFVMALDSDQFASAVPGLKKRRSMGCGSSIIMGTVAMGISLRMAALKLLRSL